MKKKLPLLLLLWSLNCLAQFSKTHYIPPLVSSFNVSAEEQFLYISTPSITPVNFRIINIGGAIVNGTVSRDIPYVYSIGFGSDTNLVLDASSSQNTFSDRGFIVEAEDLVYVTARLIAGNGNQAGEIVSKGMAALGTRFRVGGFRNPNDGYSENGLTFISVLATDNNTTVNFSGMQAGVTFINNEFAGNAPFSVTLNSGESFVAAVQGPSNGNRQGLLGTLVTSDKPIAVNCGSFGGTNGTMANLDLGFDQIVSAERTGTDYIFIKSTGMNEVETVLIIADEDGTEVTRNGSPGVITLNAGEYVFFEGFQFDGNGNMSVHTNKNVFAYQSIGDDARGDQANQEMFFVPPLSCETPKVIDNIPFINEVGTREFNGRITMVTEVGSTLNFNVNGTDLTLAGLAATGVTIVGPTSVTGNADFETYTILGLDGHVAVTSTTQLYLASYGSSDAATFGGYYSGFTFKPEVTFDQIDITQENCLPNVQLTVNTITGFDTFQWYLNGSVIPGATLGSFTPTEPGYYYVKAGIAACGTELISDNIPVSLCAPDTDADGTTDNSDIDLDNDGITNCQESFGDVPFNLSNPLAGNVNAGSGAYTNSFTGSFPAGVGTPTAVPFAGSANGNFVTSVSAGNGNSVVYQMNFAQPVSFSLEYVTTANAADLTNTQGEFIVSAPTNRTITVLNPDNQLLIDTNYDGIYESGITQFSSFEIRFRLNGTNPLAAGSGTFSFRCHLANTLTFTHKNLDAAAENRATFRIVASCVPRDSDGDGTPDALDLDSDNDSIPDFYESQGDEFEPLSGNDTNSDGLDDSFPQNMAAADSDNDGHPDFLDLDSDNNGIFDLTESGSTAIDANNDGIIDGAPATFGSNGLANGIETAPNSGIINFNMADADSDGIWDFIESDNDGDECNDVLEAGFTDANSDGFIGNAAPVVNASGVVTSAGGYTTPNPNYNIPAPIVINTQPVANPTVTCELQNAVIAIDVNPGVTYQWQVSTNGTTYTNISDGPLYSGTTTNTLTITDVVFAMNGYKYRALLNRAGNVCGKVSDAATIQVNALPPVLNRTLVQCDTGDNPDGITIFNLSEADQSFLNGNTNFSLAYFLNATEAENNGTPLDNDYTNISNPQPITVKLTDLTTGCYSLSTLNLSVNLLANVTINLPGICDELTSEDGFTQFDLTDADIGNSPSQNVRFYETVNDALLEQNEIQNPQNYTNLTAYDATIYARLENTNANSCSRLYIINLKVYRLPDIDTNDALIPHVVCLNSPTFTTQIDAGILDGSSPSDYNYSWYYEGGLIANTAPTLTVIAEGLYSVRVTNSHGCSKLRYIPVIHSSQAIIESVDVVDFVDSNTITVTLGANSFGNYTYSLDHENAGQISNVFTDVAPGVHTIYVMDANGCPSAIWTDVSVMGFPKYFTPNADGFHDTWNLKGATGIRNTNSIVRIFDRYGKLLKQLKATSDGWDGTYNGRPMPSDDYWFVIELEDGRSAKGHFTLKR
ncbi:T9SS type B sorting domain-containing protein [Flavobacterium sp. MAH-1]|uniref:T9SS type B sorting domain-containing protein n=1 Tax=Flavobacterium agri TaxID=2743471 RepID=A0A7Y8Y4I9_9FLAO|nr:T9SS type B sorting domain-containing protein [Flavobacterium agri]NUY81141.1 T9SS type B sorting domain-containing protein [Flavobacterium agri]NYA71165.1 T9SS type B sorting domain-containing protein [Flavobacterium agri]